MRERDKRTVLRRHEKGEDAYEVIKEFVEIEGESDPLEPNFVE